MATQPLTPLEVDALLSDPRTSTADMLVLRDALLRMGGALDKLSRAVTRLHESAETLGEESARLDRQVPRDVPPRAD